MQCLSSKQIFDNVSRHIYNELNLGIIRRNSSLYTWSYYLMSRYKIVILNCNLHPRDEITLTSLLKFDRTILYFSNISWLLKTSCISRTMMKRCLILISLWFWCISLFLRLAT